VVASVLVRAASAAAPPALADGSSVMPNAQQQHC
jgi:hypothetical protein